MFTGSPFLPLSQHLEQRLTARNLRGMAQLRPHLRPGYLLRAARLFNLPPGSTVLIGTGFPVLDTFETDGPIGALALYHCALQLKLQPLLLCGDPLYSVLAPHYRCLALAINQRDKQQQQAQQILAQTQPALVLSIERPGLSAQGTYVNMRGEDISSRCASFDAIMDMAPCPTLAIGDGGNEIGMGNLQAVLGQLNITPSLTQCDELVLADVSNWAAWGIIAMLSILRQQDLLAGADFLPWLQFLVANGCIDGVTRQPSLTEDGLPYQEGMALLHELQQWVQAQLTQPKQP